MELIAGDVEAFHLCFADLDALLIAARVESALDCQAGLGRRRTDQLDHGEAIRQLPSAPVLRDVTEQSVLDLVPLRCARRIVVDTDREPSLVGNFCSSTFQSRTRVPFEPPQSAVIVNSRACG